MVAKAVTISPPNMKVAEFKIRGDSCYVQRKFSEEAKAMMRAKQEAGSTASKGKKRAAKDFDAQFKAGMHFSEEGWNGIPAPAFRKALISACKLVGFAMTRAKLSLFCLADGIDKDDGTPLVKITKGKPRRADTYVRLATGVADVAPYAQWAPGWEAIVRIRYDADQFTLEDVASLMQRVGVQVGIGVGRPDSTTSAGMGWGTFVIVEK